MATASTAETLLSAQEFGQRPDPGYPEELVRGRIVPMPPPLPRHGEICLQVGFLLKLFLRDHDVGRGIGNDSGVITERGPDTVRGPDVAYYSYARLPKGPVPDGYLNVVPDLVFEVRSPNDRTPKLLRKVDEYLEAGTTAVVVLDDDDHSARVYTAETERTLGPDDELTLPDILPDFCVAVRRFFE